MLSLQERKLDLLKNKDMEGLKALLAEAEEIETLHAFYDLSDEDQVIVFRLLAKDRALTVFEELDTDAQQNLLRSFTAEHTAEFVNTMAPDDRVRLLEELPASVAKRLLASISPEERKITDSLMGYGPETAGRIMTTEFITLRKNMTAEKAMDKVRKQAKDKETIYSLYVTDDKKKLYGTLSLKELICADSNTLVEDIMSKRTISVFTGEDQEAVARTMQELDLLAIPVVDKEGCIVGIVTIDDAVDILEEEATEDILTSGGIFASKESYRSEVLVKGSIWAVLKVRMPFLFITIIGGLLAAIVLDGFEEVLEAVVVVAFFIPLIMDMGGSVGTQSSTAFARGVVLGHINLSKFFKHFGKEIVIGLCIGVIAGTISGTIAAVWQGDIMLGIAVGGSLALTVTLAATLGFLVPFILMKLNADQAAGAAPIITTIKDISGILIYFTTVSILLASLIAAATDYVVTEVHVTARGFHFVLCLEEETATVIGREDYASDFEIPETITVMGQDFKVIKISDNVFKCLGLMSAALPCNIEASEDDHTLSPALCCG